MDTTFHFDKLYVLCFVFSNRFFYNIILFAVCAFSKLYKKMYTIACRRVLTSTPL
jgi:hypothetical protein